ncbi:MAG: hypothetical protein ACKOKG_04870, partial [Verrucomicrobiota bacterium]
AVGFWGSPRDIASQWKIDRVFEPRISRDEAQTRRNRWSQALDRARSWETPPTRVRRPRRPLAGVKKARRDR